MSCDQTNAIEDKIFKVQVTGLKVESVEHDHYSIKPKMFCKIGRLPSDDNHW